MPKPSRSAWQDVAPALDRLVSAMLIGLVRLYQWTLGWVLGGQCRFYPTCSNYGIQAIRKYGAVLGAIKTVKRILRCHPWHPGGVDYP